MHHVRDFYSRMVHKRSKIEGVIDEIVHLATIR